MRSSRDTIGERRTTHGHTRGRERSPTYRSWACMKTRCTNPRTPKFHLHGGRGVTVCERWASFENFLQDMGERPSLAHSLDRFPNPNGNYEPSNCRWATSSEQSRNRKTCRPVIREDGLRFETIIDAAEATGGNRRCIRDVCTGRQKSHHGFSWSFAE